MTATVHEAEARQRKVDALLRVIDDAWTDGHGTRVGPDAADALAGMSPTWWARLADTAHVRPPSAATIAAVVQAVRDRARP